MPLLVSKARIATLRIATAVGQKFVASHTRLERRQHHACDKRVDCRQQFWPNAHPQRILQSAWGMARRTATNLGTPNYSNCVSLIRGLRASAHYLRCEQYSGTASTGTPRLRPLFTVQTVLRHGLHGDAAPPPIIYSAKSPPARPCDGTFVRRMFGFDHSPTPTSPPACCAFDMAPGVCFGRNELMWRPAGSLARLGYKPSCGDCGRNPHP